MATTTATIKALTVHASEHTSRIPTTSGSLHAQHESNSSSTRSMNDACDNSVDGPATSDRAHDYFNIHPHNRSTSIESGQDDRTAYYNVTPSSDGDHKGKYNLENCRGGGTKVKTGDNIASLALRFVVRHILASSNRYSTHLEFYLVCSNTPVLRVIAGFRLLLGFQQNIKMFWFYWELNSVPQELRICSSIASTLTN
ncbi:hypothetical protein L218DRAFT_948983 [Marasmius fiardii PR-910]|nr:hypothetical protein L218DRAFT_948983 [Marasmius fiardii PR-910]